MRRSVLIIMLSLALIFSFVLDFKRSVWAQSNEQKETSEELEPKIRRMLDLLLGAVSRKVEQKIAVFQCEYQGQYDHSICKQIISSIEKALASYERRNISYVPYETAMGILKEANLTKISIYEERVRQNIHSRTHASLMVSTLAVKESENLRVVGILTDLESGKKLGQQVTQIPLTDDMKFSLKQQSQSVEINIAGEDPTSANDQNKAALEKANKSFRAQNYASALQLYEKAAEQDQNNENLLLRIGYMYETIKENYDQARGYYERSVQANPQSVVSRGKLGDLYRKEGESEKSLKEYQQALEIEPNNPKIIHNIGLIYSGMTKLQEAIDSFKKTLEINPQSFSTYNNLGVLLHQQKKDEEAFTALQKAIELNPQYPTAYNNLGSLYYNQGKTVLAVNMLQKALELQPKYDNALYNLALAYEQINTTKALESWQIYLANISEGSKSKEKIAKAQSHIARLSNTAPPEVERERRKKSGEKKDIFQWIKSLTD